MIDGKFTHPDMIKSYIDETLSEISPENTDSLASDKFPQFFNRLLLKLGFTTVKLSEENALEVVKKTSQNYEGKANKEELYEALQYLSNNWEAVVGKSK